MRVLPRYATGVFKDSYLLDFLDLPERNSEADLQTSLLRNLRKFVMELGDGFSLGRRSASTWAIKIVNSIYSSNIATCNISRLLTC
jgi:predicted nuclease of restriction endonuclease-like (RecB) superfamily